MCSVVNRSNKCELQRRVEKRGIWSDICCSNNEDGSFVGKYH